MKAALLINGSFLHLNNVNIPRKLAAVSELHSFIEVKLHQRNI